MTDTITETELPDVKTEKPRGDCTGCAFNYQLGTARSGEFKGQLVIRKHNSRTGPGLCSGAQQPPKGTPDPMPLPGETDADFREVIAEHNGDAFTTPAHVHVFNDWDATGKYCTCGAEEDDDETDPDTGVPTSVLADTVFAGKEDPASPMFDNPGPRGHERPMSTFLAVGVESGHVRPDGRTPQQQAEIDRRMADPVGSALATLPAPVSGMVAKSGEDQFTTPGPASDIPEGSVSMQPEPDRDRWGRYLILGQPHTRTTTFVKSASSTFTLNQWQQRMTVKGLTLRPDLLALAHGLDVKRDKQQLNSIAEQAKEAAGQKVAANLGSAYHAFSERLDAGLITLADIPQIYRHRLEQYQDVIRRAGLTTRLEWIERTTGVRADQVSAALPVAGMLDRIWQLPNGELVIGDLKTGSDLSYGWGEITAQLAVYAHGVNTHGLFDWNRKVWQQHVDTPGGMMPMNVRTDFAIVMHLPADGDGCTLYRVDLVAGWRRAQICGRVMALNNEKDLAFPITVPDVVREEAPAVAAPTPAIAAVPDDRAAWESAVSHFSNADSRARLAELYQFAMDSGMFTEQQLGTLAAIGQEQLQVLGLA